MKNSGEPEDSRKEVRRKPENRQGSKNRAQILDRAKGIVMERLHINESEAHKYIQKRAMDSGTGLVEMSEMIILLYGEKL